MDMNFYGSLAVVPKLPAKIKGLKDLAYNLWWSWNEEAEELFKRIDEEAWVEVDKNPVELLAKVPYEELEAISEEDYFIKKYKRVMQEFNDYLKSEDTWFNQNYSFSRDDNQVMAYFSTEFGLHETLPIYSGGLGVLSGDHCKSASDLGLPLVGVGLLYHHGYFKQRIDENGWQKELYPELSLNKLPITTVKDNEGRDLIVSVNLAEREVFIKVWQVEVGRVSIYLLDTNIPENSKADRELTAQLYGGDQEMRISQEIILGIGGAKALQAMGYSPILWHMNEGHSVYLGLERIKQLVKEEDLGFRQALESVAANTVFTTHTPVPAGNERFPNNLKENYFKDYWQKLGLSKEDFLNLGRIKENEEFCLTVLGLYLARFVNGVSELHGQVASEMWEEFWSGVPANENPITYITNGVHTLSWLATEWQELFNEFFVDDWEDRISYQEVWEEVKKIPNDIFWRTHQDLKRKMIDYIYQSDLERKKRYTKDEELHKNRLHEDILTVGFSRRFATYKRADLLFEDLDRLDKICNQNGKEVQFIFAGKAHPADMPGQKLIKKIHNIAESDRFKDKIILLEDYDIEMARHLVQGVDVWLNNPRRPLEASGTSGQKVAINGGLNLSVLDGWWCEGYNGRNGWVIGREEGLEYRDDEEQDLIDSQSLYKTLEEKIVPLYYDTGEEGLPVHWINYMKEAIASTGATYSTDRMLKEYVRKLYMPAMERGKQLKKEDYKKAKELTAWKEKLERNWQDITITSPNQGEQGKFNIRDKINLEVEIGLGTLTPEDVTVEAYVVSGVKEGEIMTATMGLKEELENNSYLYSAEVELKEAGTHKYTFRVIPNQVKLSHKHELGLIKWI
ncbi:MULTISPECIES: alpha-glucan family phosphorylase [unclassified Candidatus Frackibacter]|uniref:alpha-glucan family phosphorylase n=1 Tax=unclassified Candidatus Frackibacter TaxID=2648818 RepID=UPI0007994F62|nr:MULTISPECIES: alpha-glucan family phosphorylase [unclassified Candidatus Frackibacter]KXS40124.1 MAG: alpha-glucan phosphorylase [Candidatus Frackibacter sp. T328-2]SDC34199.1 maltodextrin phosphorylase [Candidatus Frackibacter sp. WG11]SEM57041.1 maltodextrin phosphorylase [Candidatus Frackibacter sp. WG12]SFL70231.1 maltodextrin phosphorylase [Candidatus Frackibacter sp. WG13]